ncbi:hypothetical protein N7481_003216 [Penicillium waksmanii]|uniref:uncharacterized protein n=1 Tax=Penicillium waksmanii TaxID=69791 RepID=UPI002548D362|nr:uncharacterized protein N7481_003216 [Penicillium waksmanii]KAJ5988006.1 hypothetical protein N7481_003216 [Penicillium waksmanii]
MPVMLLENYGINCYLDVANMMYKPPPAEHPSDDELPSAGDVNSLAHLFKNWGWWHSILFLIIMIVAAGLHRAVQCYIKRKFDIRRAR